MTMTSGCALSITGISQDTAEKMTRIIEFKKDCEISTEEDISGKK